MKAISVKPIKAVQIGTVLKCIDNTGAKLLKVIGVKGYKGTRRRIARAGVGDVVICTVIKGNEKIRNEVVHAVVVRQRRKYRRRNGMFVCFEDNAAVLINERMEPRGREIKGVVAKEAVERFPAVGKIASIVM